MLVVATLLALLAGCGMPAAAAARSLSQAPPPASEDSFAAEFRLSSAQASLLRDLYDRADPAAAVEARARALPAGLPAPRTSTRSSRLSASPRVAPMPAHLPVQADLASAGITVVRPPPFPAPLPESADLFDAVLLGAVQRGRVPAVEALLAGLADPNTVNKATGETPLFAAVGERKAEPQLLPLLLQSETAAQGACRATR